MVDISKTELGVNHGVEYSFSIAVVGDSGVGKTTLLKRLVHPVPPPTEHVGPTIGTDFSHYFMDLDDETRILLRIWDTAGMEKFRSVPANLYQKALGVVVVYDITRPETFKSVNSWLKEASENVLDSNVQYMILGNKLDLAEVTEGRQVPPENGQQLETDGELNKLEPAETEEGRLVHSENGQQPETDGELNKLEPAEAEEGRQVPSENDQQLETDEKLNKLDLAEGAEGNQVPSENGQQLKTDGKLHKLDLAEGKVGRQVSTESGRQYERDGQLFYETSVITRENINEAFTALGRAMYEKLKNKEVEPRDGWSGVRKYRPNDEFENSYVGKPVKKGCCRS